MKRARVLSAIGAWLVALSATGAPREARAQPAQPPPRAAPQGIELPKLIEDPGAAYPEQALHEGFKERVTVPLVLTIDATGKVTDARVKTPAGHGFDEAALEAAKRVRFQPATRNGVPFAITIGYSYSFAPPPGALAGRVFAKNGAPLANAHVEVMAPTGERYDVATDANGRWRVARAPIGHYRVRIEASGFEATAWAELDVDPGQEVSVTDRLEPEKREPLPLPVPVTSGSAAPNEPPPVVTEEVTVKGARPPREVTKRTIEQREIERVPGTNGDALRSLQNLPGVARPPGGLGILIVRGSAPQDTNIFVDGTLIPIVYHFGGLSSVVPSEILDKIDFYPGNFSAEYGRGIGGIVDVGIRDPKKDKLHGMAQVDLIDARMVAEGPLGGGWSFMVGGRRSYVDVWLKPVLERSGAQVTTAPVYYDYQAMVEKDLTPRSNFRLFFFGSDDRLDILTNNVNGSNPAFAGDISTHTGFWRVQARYQNKIDDATRLRMTAAVGEDFVDFTLGDNFFHIDSYPVTTRVELAEKMAPGVTANLGLDMLYTPYSVSARFPAPNTPGQPSGGPFLTRPSLETQDKDAIYRPGVYGELEMTPLKGTRIVPGLRLDYAKDTKAWDFAPRLTARQDVHSDYPRTTLKGGVGVFFQPPQPQETNVVFGTPGLRSERALHYDLGVEQDITHQIDVSFDAFYKQLDYMVLNKLGNTGTGFVYGTETLLRYKPDERFFGWLAYTLSRSVRRDFPGAPLHLSNFDQTHILTVLGSYRIGKGWELGARYRLVSGNPYTPNTYGFFDENSSAYLPLLAYPTFGERMPVFHQLDVRVDKGWQLGPNIKLGVYLDVQNVYNMGNVEGVSYNYNSTQHTFATGLPIIPSLGVRGEL